jgi:hypothetical protein
MRKNCINSSRVLKFGFNMVANGSPWIDPISFQSSMDRRQELRNSNPNLWISGGPKYLSRFVSGEPSLRSARSKRISTESASIRVLRPGPHQWVLLSKTGIYRVYSAMELPEPVSLQWNVIPKVPQIPQSSIRDQSAVERGCEWQQFGSQWHFKSSNTSNQLRSPRPMRIFSYRWLMEYSAEYKESHSGSAWLNSGVKITIIIIPIASWPLKIQRRNLNAVPVNTSRAISPSACFAMGMTLVPTFGPRHPTSFRY